MGSHIPFISFIRRSLDTASAKVFMGCKGGKFFNKIVNGIGLILTVKKQVEYQENN